IAVWNPHISQYQFLNSRAIARLSGFPDWYYVPEKVGYANYIFGLSVPPFFVSKVLSSFT
ncbi:MAG: DNA cytosine methyltransferase, partial [Trichodesmium sp. St18_bin1]|nr:DNA cytosine methyltransferase [Trichodesmium sp. St18_bin1]